MKCKSCKSANVELAGEHPPHSEEHWMCPECHGIYPIGEYPIGNIRRKINN